MRRIVKLVQHNVAGGSRRKGRVCKADACADYKLTRFGVEVTRYEDVLHSYTIA